MDKIEKKVINSLEKVNVLSTFIARWKAEMPIWAKVLSSAGKWITGLSGSLAVVDTMIHFLPEEVQASIRLFLGYLALTGVILTIFANQMVKTETKETTINN